MATPGRTRIPTPSAPRRFGNVDLANAGREFSRNPNAYANVMADLTLEEAMEAVCDLHVTERENLLPYMGFTPDEGAKILAAPSTVEFPDEYFTTASGKRQEFRTTAQEAQILSFWKKLRPDRHNLDELGSNLARAAREQLAAPDEPTTNGYARAFQKLLGGKKSEVKLAMAIQESVLNAGLSLEDFSKAFGAARAKNLEKSEIPAGYELGQRDAVPADFEVADVPRQRLPSEYPRPLDSIYGPKVAKQLTPEATVKNTDRPLYPLIQAAKDIEAVESGAGLRRGSVIPSLSGNTTTLGRASTRSLTKESTLDNKIAKLEERIAKWEAKEGPRAASKVDELKSEKAAIEYEMGERRDAGTLDETVGATSGLEPVPVRPWWQNMDAAIRFLEQARKQSRTAGTENIRALKRGNTPIRYDELTNPVTGEAELRVSPKDASDADAFIFPPGVEEAIANIFRQGVSAEDPLSRGRAIAPVRGPEVRGSYVPELLRTGDNPLFMNQGEEAALSSAGKSDLSKRMEVLERYLQQFSDGDPGTVLGRMASRAGQSSVGIPTEMRKYLESPRGSRRSQAFVEMVHRMAKEGKLMPIDWLWAVHRANVLQENPDGGLRLAPLSNQDMALEMSAGYRTADRVVPQLRDLLEGTREVYSTIPPQTDAAKRFDGQNFTSHVLRSLMNKYIEQGMSDKEIMEIINPEKWDRTFQKKPYGKKDFIQGDYEDVPDMTDQSSAFKPKRLLSALMV